MLYLASRQMVLATFKEITKQKQLEIKNFIHNEELMIEEININQLIREALVFLEHHTRSHLTINLILDENSPKIFIDKIKITQVILNLAQNSLEAFSEQSHVQPLITIKTQLENNFIEINFQDNGPGIPPKYMDKIMTSYFTTKSQGTGLGLAICRTIIEAHQGNLIVKPVTEGAYITFLLPFRLK